MFDCNQCNYQATRSDILTVHIKSKHLGIKYPCIQCQYQATEKNSLKKHIENVHNIIWLSISDIDSDGYIDLFETDKGHYNVPDWYGWEGVNGNTPARWEWNGTRFIRISPN